MSSALPRATLASTEPLVGDLVSNVLPEIDGTILPPIMCPMPSTLNCLSSGAARSRLAWKISAFGVALSMRGLRFRNLRFQRLVNVVALPAGFLVVDLHVERQREFAPGENRIEMGREHLENVFARFRAGWEIAPLAKPQHHIEKAELRIAVGNRIMFAANGADPNPPERKDPGFHRGLAGDFADLADIDAGIEIGGIFKREMRHFRPPNFFADRRQAKQLTEP